MQSDDEKRQRFITDLGEFITSSKNWLEEYVKNIGWNLDEFKNMECKDSPATCPFNSGHRMPQSSLAKHIETCAWIHEEYSKEDKETALPSSHFFYTSSTSVVPVLIDKTTQANILKMAAKQVESGIALGKEDKNVPRTMERAIYELSPQERLAIYEYVITKAKETNKQSTVKIEDLQINFEKKNEQGKREKTHLELLAEQRDYKRRRQSYRAKNVHITKKSYTEVMREVIQNQMDLLEDLAREDDDVVPETSKKEDHSERDHKHRNERYSSSRNSPSQNEINSSSRKHDHRSSRHRHYDRHNDRDTSRDRHRHKHKHHKHKKSRRKSSSSDDS